MKTLSISDHPTSELMPTRNAPAHDVATCRFYSRWSQLLLVTVWHLTVSCALAENTSRDKTDFFERHVRPLLNNRCVKCHGTVRQLGAFRLDTSEGMFHGSTNGPVVTPGNPDDSPLIQLVRGTAGRRMPPPPKKPDNPSDELKKLYDNLPLDPHEIEILERWVKDGAIWPGYSLSKPSETVSQREFNESEKSFWSFQPIHDPTAPSVRNITWPSNNSSLDRFILAKLEAVGLEPAPPADRSTLIRRVTYDLTGLPPTPEEIQAYLQSDSPDAYRDLIDRLLDSPRYGERWGRHWLDVARYAETAGHDGNNGYLHAWRYRDWVINAFNQDMPYDDFVVAQLAGDLLPTTDDKALNLANHVATGFLQIGSRPLVMRDKRQMLLEIVDEQVHATGVAFMGLTLGCARCHDHKFDPIPTLDYYSLAGIFMNTRVFDDYERDSMHLEPVIEGPDGPVSIMSVCDKPRTRNMRVHLRGNYHTLGEEAPRRFLQIIAGTDHGPIKTDGSGRLELAHWIASPDHPLTARVMVNRIWQKHFGTGLVKSTDDFGIRGNRPSHPELFDWLAQRLIESGWSIKAMHRLIMNSNTYKQSHIENQTAMSTDPENVLLWRIPRRRLSAEEIRDTMLILSGKLDLTIGGPLFNTGYSLLQPPRKITVTQVNDLYGFTPYQQPRRSIYLPVIRNQLHPILALFDSANEHESVGKRTLTTIAPQALFFLNSKFVREHAKGLADRLLSNSELTNEQRTQHAYELVFGRRPTNQELQHSSAYRKSYLDTIKPKRDELQQNQLNQAELPTYADQVLQTPGLLAYYDFEENGIQQDADSKDTVQTFSNLAAPGTADARTVGPIVSHVPGVPTLTYKTGTKSYAVALNGQNQRIVISDPARFNVDTRELSVEYWFYPERISIATIVGRDGQERLWKSGISGEANNGSQQYEIFHEFFPPELGQYRAMKRQQPLASIKQWTHVVLTCGKGRRQLFVDGTLADVMVVPNAPIPGGKIPVGIGSRGDVGEWFQGRIDDLSIYNQVLSETAVVSRYVAATGKLPSAVHNWDHIAWTSFCQALLCMNEFIYVQ